MVENYYDFYMYDNVYKIGDVIKYKGIDWTVSKVKNIGGRVEHVKMLPNV